MALTRKIRSRCMSRYRIIVAVALSAILCLGVSGLLKDLLDTPEPVAEGSSADVFASYLDQRVPRLMQAYQIPGTAIALVKSGVTVWSNAYGLADLETGRPMTTDTYMRVQSISKPVTAWGVMKLAEDGLIDLDRPVVSYLRDWTFPDNSSDLSHTITIRQLLNHTAGLGLGDVMTIYAPDSTMPSLEARLSQETLVLNTPGKQYAYSNTGYNLLELLIESVTGQDFSGYMDAAVLKPLGMDRASFSWQADFSQPVPTGYKGNGQPVPVYVYPEKASGGLFADVQAIADFVSANMADFAGSQTVLQQDTVRVMHQPSVTIKGFYQLVFDSYGLGFFTETLSNGQLAISHGGQGTGVMTQFFAIPGTGDGLVILTNSQRSWPFFALILGDWCRWCSLPPVGMNVIWYGELLVWLITGILFTIAFWFGTGLIDDMRSRRRSMVPLARETRLLRGFQASAFILISAILVWSLCQPYLLISSIFPRPTPWLGLALLLLGLTMLLAALMPRTPIKTTSDVI